MQEPTCKLMQLRQLALSKNGTRRSSAEACCARRPLTIRKTHSRAGQQVLVLAMGVRVQQSHACMTVQKAKAAARLAAGQQFDFKA